MSNSNESGFQIASDNAILILGYSERKEVGDYLASALDERKIFENIDLITLNRAAALLGRASLRQAMLERTVITHSGGIMYVPRALQVVAINPPEPVSLPQLIKRANEVTKDPIDKEPGAHDTGILDLLKAGLELARSPLIFAKAPIKIARGYSTTERLISGAEDFPAGRAMVHSELDTFGFAKHADMERASAAGITTVMLPNQYHNEVLLAPKRTLDQLTPVIFPESN